MSKAMTKMTLDEWCAELPDFHLANKQLKDLRQQLSAETKRADKAERRLAEVGARYHWLQEAVGSKEAERAVMQEDERATDNYIDAAISEGE